jgi:hypothetical protein
MLRLLRRSICAFALLLAPVTVFCWDPAPACKQYWEADAIFTGLVIDNGLDREDETWGNRLARLKVERVFVGLQDEKEVDIDPGITTECYLRLRTGQRYFFYAKRDAEGRLRTSHCLGSIRLDIAQEDLQFARRVAQGSSMAFLFGTANGNSHGPLAGVEILASGQGRQYRAVTNAEGHFTIAPVEAGKYEVRAAHVGYVSEAPVYTGEVHNRGCAEVNVKLWTDGRISGTLRDSTGAPLPKIMAQLAALDEDGELDSKSEVVSDEDGHFEFTKLVAGTYVLGVNLDNEPSAEFPFPATRYPAPIPLAEGQKLSDIDLRLPPRLPGRTIHVQAVWPDGRPAAEVRIEGDCAWRSTETDADGRALLQTLAGVGCTISAKARISPGEYARSNTVIVPPGDNAAAVVLALH